MWNQRELSRKEIMIVFVVLSFAYIYPLVHADYAYVDDNWRALHQAQDAWKNQGRILLEVLHRVLTFTGGTTNIFPLPLLISVFALALAMTRLTLWYFTRPGILSCLVVLPILCNPFFLGNLTYQFDGPGMVLAVVAIIYAITCTIEHVVYRGFASALLIAISLSLYQPTLSLFVGLSIVEFVCGVKNRISTVKALSLATQRFVQLTVGSLIYALTAYQLTVDGRGNLSVFDARWLEVAGQKLIFAMEQVGLLVNPGAIYFTVLLLVVATFAFVLFMKNIVDMPGAVLSRVIVLAVYLLGFPILLLSIPGVMLFLVEPNLDARNYIGFSAVLILVLYLNYEVLGRAWLAARWVLVVPVLFMFAFCYAYGQVIIAKKELEMAMAQYIAKDIVSEKQLGLVPVFYFVGPQTGGNWLPRGHDAMTYMPALRYILSNANVLLHPHFFPRLGINNVVGGKRDVFNKLVALNGVGSPVVDSKFYSIYVTSEGGYIVMKEIRDSENYNDIP